MADQIVLQGISARGHHGVLDFERREGQTFVVDVVMSVDLAPAGASDRLDDTVNYAEVAGDVVALVEGEPLDLIEALAARIADRVLARPLVEAVDVVVHKPEAPVGHPFTDVQVRICRERREPVVIALGANLGDARHTLGHAVAAVARLPGVEVHRVSGLYQTEPVGGPAQLEYANAVLLASTARTPSGLLRALHAIEEQHGRVRDVHWGPRTLDLDLVQYGDPGSGHDVQAAGPELTLPHPRAHERAFVLVPWLDADPAARLRVAGEVRPVAELLKGLDSSGVRKADSPWRPDW